MAQIKLMAGGKCARRNRNFGKDGAQTKVKHEFCHNPVPHKGDACYRHGGKTPKGIASPNWKGGRFSKHLPKGMLEEYERTLRDPARHAFDEGVSLLDTLIVNRAQSMSRESTEDAWEAAGELAISAFDEWEHVGETMLAVRAAKTTEDFSIRLDELEALISQLGGPLNGLRSMAEDGVDEERKDRRVRAEMRDLLKERRQYVSAEHSRRYRERVSISIAELATFVARQQQIMAENIRAMVPGEIGEKLLARVVDAFRSEQRRALPETNVIEVEVTRVE